MNFFVINSIIVRAIRIKRTAIIVNSVSVIALNTTLGSMASALPAISSPLKKPLPNMKPRGREADTESTGRSTQSKAVK